MTLQSGTYCRPVANLRQYVDIGMSAGALQVVYTRIFDLKHERKGWGSYFYPTLLAYSVGLVLTYIALILQIGGQQVHRSPLAFAVLSNPQSLSCCSNRLSLSGPVVKSFCLNLPVSCRRSVARTDDCVCFIE